MRWGISRTELSAGSKSICSLYGSGGTAGRSVLDLDFDVGDGGACPGQVGGLGLGVLGVVIRDGGLDSILGEHGAVDC